VNGFMQIAGVVMVCAFMGISGMGISGATEIDFDTEIMPLLSKAGCNAANCHGSAAGQAGFRLSLFGGDPAFDYRTIARERFGRRLNHLRPSESLVIAKPTGQLEHGGGEVLDPDGRPARTIAQWIREGAHRSQQRQLDRLVVEPREFIADSVPASLQIQVTAIFDDGVQRDVTDQAVYVSQNESAVVVNELGAATVTGPGRHAVIVRFADQMAAISCTIPIGSTPVMASDWDADNWIDDEINETLRLLRLTPARAADDESFLRRLSLDLTGRLPTPSQVQRFANDDEPSKRTRLIESMLDSDGYVEYWTHRLAIQLRLRKPGDDLVAANAFYAWLQQSVDADTGWNTIATELITSEGDTHRNGAATVHRFFAGPREEAEYLSEVLMGVRLRCANCHNHPLDQWTQDDYHGLAAIFAGYQRAKDVRFTENGSVIHPRTESDAIPRIPGQRFLPAGADNRREFAEWLTRADNPTFARAMVVRVWDALMGQGLITPVDDLRQTNPASHPKLVDRLSVFFAENGFQLRPLIRLICESSAYQRAATSPGASSSESSSRFYSHAIRKTLSAEVLADAISDATGVNHGEARFINVVERATTSDQLQFLGQCLPGENCSSPVGDARGIASKLHLMNGELLNRLLVDDAGRLQQMLRDETATRDLVRDFYVRALSRSPTENELSDWVARIDSGDAKQKAERCQDFLWALLNCHEFTTNH